jgi:hypothetical protein
MRHRIPAGHTLQLPDPPLDPPEPPDDYIDRGVAVTFENTRGGWEPKRTGYEDADYKADRDARKDRPS